MTVDPEDLFHDADGIATVPPDSPTSNALARLPGRWLFSGSAAKTMKSTRPLAATSMTRSDCQRRFRRRVVYPVGAVIFGIPICMIIFGALGAISRGEFEQDLPEMLSIAGFFVVGGLVLVALLTPVWRREYRVRVTDVEPDNLSVQADATGLTLRRDDQVTVQATWSDLSLVAVRLQEINDGRTGTSWDMVALTLGDGKGRRDSLPVYRLDHGHRMAHRILATLADRGRLNRA